jgi:hypothetical protein
VGALYRAYIDDEVLGPVGLPVDDAAMAAEIPAYNEGSLVELWFERELG